MPPGAEEAAEGRPAPKPLKLGVRLSPPSLLLVYRPAAGGGVLRLRKMPVKSLTQTGSCTRVAQELRERHCPHLDNVPQNKLLKMLRILQVGADSEFISLSPFAGTGLYTLRIRLYSL